MKSFFILILFLLTLGGNLPLSAQCDRDYPEVLRLAKESLAERDYQLAIYRFLDARDICPDKKNEVNDWINETFRQIVDERDRAEREKDRADSILRIVVTDRLKDVQAEIYELEYEEAERILLQAASFGVGEEEVLEGFAELIFFYTEAGKTSKAWPLYEAAGAIASGTKSLTNTDSLAYLSDLVKNWTDSTAYDRIYFRYYPRMIFVEGGEFIYQKGAYNRITRKYDLEGIDTKVSSFYMAQTETTVWQYYLFTRSIDSAMVIKPAWGYNGDNPVGAVSWKNSQRYIQWLSKRTNEPYFMPGEAVWEYAARGGQHSHGYIYAGSDSINEVAWYYSNAERRTRSVGMKAPNELGLYDLTGNVWEWCEDLFDGDGLNRVFRGGGWTGKALQCQISDRIRFLPTNSSYDLGFRVARTP